MGTQGDERGPVACPDCGCPQMQWSVVIETYWCLICPHSSTIKDWVFKDGKLVNVDRTKHIEELRKRDAASGKET